MAKKMRTINNPLDRQTRNDINYNFGVLDDALSDMATTGAEANERFTRIENDVVKLKNEDKNLSDRIDANEKAIEDMDIDAIKLQGEIAEQQGIEAKKKGDKAEQQGNLSEQKGNVAEEQGVIAETKGIKAEQQGNYAKEMGDYAKEKAEYAAEKTSEIEQAHTDLSQIKVEAVDATQNANTQAEYAKEQGDYAKLVGDEVADKLDEIESVKQDVISKGETTQAQGLKAKEQGDYAQSVIDSYKHVGEWQGSVEYKKNQEVLFNGSTYRALLDNKGTQPTDKSKWQLIAQRGVDGEGAVASVNGIMPDSDGNVNLGDIASKEYVDDKIGDVDFSSLETKTDATAKLEEAKQYTDTQISEIPEVDLTPLETKEDAQAKLTEAKQYTDEKIGDVDLSALETKEDATAKLEEAKGYTDEEIAKIPIDEPYVFPKSTAISANDSPEAYPEGVSILPFDNTVDWASWQQLRTKVLADPYASLENITTTKRIIDGIVYAQQQISVSGTASSGRIIFRTWQFNRWEARAIGNAGMYQENIDVNRQGVAFGEGVSANSIRGTSFSFGKDVKTEGAQGFSAGEDIVNKGDNSIVLGDGLSTDRGAQVVLGKFNQETSGNLIFGGGRGDDARSNYLTLNYSALTIIGEYKTGGADYAEMFEWEDKNPENIDRVALAVTWGDGESIKLANSGDEIIGVVSATAAILGDDPMDWDKRFVTDQFGRPLRKEYTEINEDGKEETYEWFVENPEYDKDAPYVSRSERPEWSAVGLMGKLYWIDDGTLEVGDYATVGSNGVATKGDKSNGWRVMKRISKNVDGNSGVVKVFFK